jgi:hypothetical protein
MSQYCWNVLLSLDQLLNTVLGGYPDETISSRLGKLKVQRGGQLTWGDWCGVALPLDWILDKIDPGHSIDAIEHDEGEPIYDRRGNVVGKVLDKRRSTGSEGKA